MRLKLTPVRKAGATDDIVVTTDAAATISDIAATIARLDLRVGAADRAAEPYNLTMRTTLPGYFDLLILPPDGAVGDAGARSPHETRMHARGMTVSSKPDRGSPAHNAWRHPSTPGVGSRVCSVVWCGVGDGEDSPSTAARFRAGIAGSLRNGDEPGTPGARVSEIQ